MTTRYIWDAVGDRSTKMTLRNSGVPRGFSRIFAPMMESAMRRANQKDLMFLRKILESDNVGTPENT